MADEVKSKKKSAGIGCVVLIGIIAAIGIFGGGGEQKDAPIIDEASAIAVTAEQLFNAYQDNEARAQQTYGGKVLKVTGAVQSVDLGLTNKPTISLVSPNEFMAVTLQSSESVTKVAPSLNKGDEITAVCGGVTEVVGRPILDGCVIK